MKKNMLAVSVCCLVATTLNAGVLTGSVKDSSGKPIEGAVITVARLNINWKKQIKTDSRGRFSMVGLDPTTYSLKVEANGFRPLEGQEKMESDTVTKDWVLKSLEESTAVAAPTAESIAAAEGTDLFNLAIDAYRGGSYAQALPMMEKARGAIQGVLDKLAAESQDPSPAKDKALEKLHGTDRAYSLTLYQLGAQDAEQRAALFAKAEPLFLAYLEKNPKDQNSLLAMRDIAKAKGDAENLKKYQALLDEVVPPDPNKVAFNQGVDFFNAGNCAAAKPLLLKVLEQEPKNAEAAYVVAICELTLGEMSAAKQHFLKYMELAPAGKHAGEVKDALKELKGIK